MYTLHQLVTRDGASQNPSLTPAVTNLLISLFALGLACCCIIAALYFIRRNRLSRQPQPQRSLLPIHNSSPRSKSNHRRLTITASTYKTPFEFSHVRDEKQALVEVTSSPPQSPIPEIRITFPEEEEKTSRPRSGRVVVVRIGETGVGLEPLEDADLPPYQKDEAQRFQSLDLERMGGLKESSFYHTKS